MQRAPFQRIPRVSVERVRAGDDAAAAEPGDILLTHGTSLFSRFVRMGERLRIHGDDRIYSWFSHAALVVGANGEIVEALGRGAVRASIEKYRPAEYVVVHVGADPGDVKEVLDFADWVVEHRPRYGWWTIASLAVTIATGAKFTFFIDGEFICSGLVARAMERTGAIFNRDPVHITPADLAKYYDARPSR